MKKNNKMFLFSTVNRKRLFFNYWNQSRTSLHYFIFFIGPILIIAWLIVFIVIKSRNSDLRIIQA